MTHIVVTSLPNLPYLMAQTQVLGLPVKEQFIGSLLDFGKGLLFLIVGWIIAWIISSVVRGLMNRTSLDNQVASWLGNASLPIEKWVGTIVFWLVFLFAVVGFLDAIKLHVVSEPINALLKQITNFLPQVLGAVFLLGIAWLLASLTKMLVTRVLGGFHLDDRLDQQLGSSNREGLSLTNTIGNAIYWLVFLLFLPAILNTLKLEGTLEPVQNLLNQILNILPNIFAAVLIGAVGWLVAQVVRRLVTNLLAATGVDGVGNRMGIAGGGGRQSLSWIIGTVAYVLVLIPAAIAALNALKIQAISVPAINMLNQVLNLLPKLFAAGVILALAYVVGKYVAELVTSILTGIGFNDVFQWLGIANLPRNMGKPGIATEQPTYIQGKTTAGRTPSQIVGAISHIAIMLVAALTAVDILGIQALKSLVGVVLAIAGQVLVGLVVFAIGLYLANLAYNLIASSGSRQAKILGQTARVAILTLISAMALQQMGIAPDIVNLAFGLLLGGIAVAIALAFGLGGRDVAGEQVKEWLNSFKK